MRAVWIVSGIVQNVTVWDETSTVPSGSQIIVVDDDAEVGPGFKYQDGMFIPHQANEETQ